MNNTATSKLQINILSLNCNSLYKKLPEIKQLVLEEAPDIMCLCETWLNNKYLPKFKNHTAIWKNREHARGGGLGILIKNSLQHQETPLIDYEGGLLEVQAIRIFMQDKSSMYILNLYNPSKNVTYEEMNHYVTQLGDRCLIIGDLNAHSPLLNEETVSSNFTGRSMETLLLEKNICLINPVNMYTYIDRTTGHMSCLDICLATSNIAPFTQIAPFSEVGSDHLVMRITVNLQPCTYKWLKTPRYKINKKSIEDFKCSYIQSKLQKPASTDSLITDLMERITESANACFGKPAEEESTTYKKRTPWWSEECAVVVKNRKLAFKNFQKHPTMENLIEYKRASAIARYTTRTNKQNSMRDFISSLTHTVPQTTIWRKMKAFTSGYVPQTFPLVHNNSPVLDPYEKAEILNRTFQMKGTINENPFIEDIEECFKKSNPTLNKPISMAEFKKTLKNLKDKAPGFDRINNKMLKDCHEIYKEEILFILNQSLALGDVPQIWKFGLILPILKPGKKPDDDQSYRPITLLPCMGKLMGKIVQSRMEYYLETERKLSPYQYGFRPGKGTEDVLLKITDQIREAINSKQACCIVYIDLKGAFDRVWRNGLLYKASKVGVVGEALRWLANYLCDRTQAVAVHGHISEKVISDTGVPQGGILSPLLFNIILGDIPKEDGIELYIFADDITLACTGANTDMIQTKLQGYVDKLHEWFQEWDFIVNPLKTKMQYFTRKRITRPILSYDSVAIESVKEQRLLGVILDAPLLTWKSHMTFLISNCTKRIGIMKSLSSPKFGASFEVLRRFYKSYIRSRITYCASSFCSASKSQLNRLNVLQNSSLRLMMGAKKSSPVSSLEAEANIPPLILYIEYLSTKTFIKLHYRPFDDPTAENLLHERSASAIYNHKLLQKYNVKTVKRKAIEALSPSATWYDIQEKILVDTIEPKDFEAYLTKEFPDFFSLYTDGSKQDTPESSVASGLYDCQLQRAVSWKLHPEHTVIAAELFAIKKALEYISSQKHGKWIVFTDSLSSLQLLSNDVKSYRETTDTIKQQLKSLNISKIVLLHWIRGHSGIKGNEVADRVANLGHNLMKSTLFPLHKEEISNILLKNMRKHWQECWIEDMLITGKGKHLGKLRDNVLSQTPVDTGSRIADVAIFRLRIGHAAVKQYLHRIKRSDTPYCNECGENETIEHYLLECKLYESQRNNFLWKIMTILKKLPDITLKLILGGENYQPSANARIINALADYLRATGRIMEL